MYSLRNRPIPVGPRLRDAREAAGLTATDVADAIGYSRSGLANIEAGRREPDEQVVAAYLAYLAERVTTMHRRNLLLAAAASAGAAAVPAAESLAGLVAGALAASAPEGRDAWESRLAERFADYLVDVGRCEIGVSADLGHLDHAGPGGAMASVTARVMALQAQLAPNERAGAYWSTAVTAADQSGDLAVRVWTCGRAALDLAYDLPTVAQALDCANRAIDLAAGRVSGGLVQALFARAHIAEATGAGDPVRLWHDALDAADLLRPADEAPSALGSGWPRWRTFLTGAHLAAKVGDARLFDAMTDAFEREAPADRSRFGAHVGLYAALLAHRLGERGAALAAADAALDAVPASNRSASLVAMRDEIAAAL